MEIVQILIKSTTCKYRSEVLVHLKNIESPVTKVPMHVHYNKFWLFTLFDPVFSFLTIYLRLFQYLPAYKCNLLNY